MVLLEAVLPDGEGDGPGHEVGVIPGSLPRQVGELNIVNSARHVGEGVVLGLDPLQGGGDVPPHAGGVGCGTAGLLLSRTTGPAALSLRISS